MTTLAFTSYAFPATGAPTPRTTPDRLAEIKNVLDFGADATGNTDSTMAIQNAINWTTGANRGTIYFPIGTYVTSAPLTFNYAGPLSICFRGEGEGSFIAATTSTGYAFDRKLASPSNEARVIFDRLLIYNLGSVAGTGAIRVGSSASVRITDCHLGGINSLTTEDSAGVSSQNIFIQDIRVQGGTNGIIMGGSGVIMGSDIRGCAVGLRLYGSGWMMTGGRLERHDTAILIGLDSAGTDQGASAFAITGMTTEANKMSIDVAGTCSGFYIGQIAFLPHFSPNSGVSGTENPERGIWIRADKAINGVLSTIAAGGDGCTVAQIQIDSSTTRANILVEECTATVLAGGGAAYVYPSNAYTARYFNCSGNIETGQPIWTYSQLPTGGNVREGDEYNISDATTATWGANVTAGGGSNRVFVRWNGTNWTVVGK